MKKVMNGLAISVALIVISASFLANAILILENKISGYRQAGIQEGLQQASGMILQQLQKEGRVVVGFADKDGKPQQLVLIPEQAATQKK